MKKLLTIFSLLILTFLGHAQSNEACSNLMSSTVEFVVNTNNFVKNKKYETFLNETVPFIKENAEKIDSILFVGSASPEGGRLRNLYLAKIRAARVYSYISNFIPKSKIVVNNDYSFFLKRTGLKEDNYQRLRATYIEIHFKEEKKQENIVRIDTIYIKETIHDTIYCYERYRDTIYIEKRPEIIPIVAIKTNLLADLLITPNVHVEVYTHLEGLSLEFEYAFPWYKVHDKFFYYQVLDGTAGIRKYFNNKYTGHYIGVYGNTLIYDICAFNKDKGWQGEGYGVGLSYGYVFASKKQPRWKFEPYIRLGWIHSKFDSYHTLDVFDDKYYYDWYGRVNEFVPRRFNMNYFGPTAIGFNLTYDLICVRKY